MKHTNEIQTILAAVFAINRTSEMRTRIFPLSLITLSADCSVRIQTFLHFPASERQKNRYCLK